jgi:hypothetical protein
MVSCIAFSLPLVLACTVGISACNGSRTRAGILVADETLWQATAVDFDYQRTLARAIEGDRLAAQKLMAFSTETDAAGALGHALVLMELMHRVGDNDFASAARALTDDEKRVAWVLFEDGALELHGEQFAKALPTIYPSTYATLAGAPPSASPK